MIPAIQGLISVVDEAKQERNIQPDKTWIIDFDKCTITDVKSGIDSLKQAVFLCLSTHSGIYEIYPENYGLPIDELLNESIPLVYVSAASKIYEALMQDDRITNVTDFIFDTDKKNVTVSFTIHSVFGKFNIEETEINV